MSGPMNMDAPSAQENCETGPSSSLRQTSSLQEHELSSRSLASEATEERIAVSAVNVNNGLTKSGAAECKYDGTKDLRQFREDASMISNSEQLGLRPEDGAGKSCNVEQAMSEINDDLVPNCVNNEAYVEKQKVDTENFENGPAEIGMVGFNHSLNHSGLLSEDATTNSTSGQSPPEDAAVNASLEQLISSTDNACKDYDPKQVELCSEDAAKDLDSSVGRGNKTYTKSTEGTHALRSSVVSTRILRSRSQEESKASEPARFGAVEVNDLGLKQSGLTKCCSSGQQRLPPENDSCSEKLRLPPEDVAVSTCLEQVKPLQTNGSKNCDLMQLESPLEDAPKNRSKSGERCETPKRSTKGKHALRQYAGSPRVLRSRSQEKVKAPEPTNNLAEHGDAANEEKRRKKRKNKLKKNSPANQFTRIRAHLRYLLHRMQYEQSLIDAYSGEGWKGQSLEKLKPEKELQRAKSEIFRCKLKIRDLFQRLDLSIAEGKLPESLFDSEGQIDSEDIFCAKCQTKDLAVDNDIILCDGACERGFHQFCLEPPLLKEDIPPDDEGWLCPGCDCKVDCIDLLNDSQGTNISVLDKWEKVFPEAAAAAAGSKQEDIGLSSDDSEDDDYNPDGLDLDEKVEGDESSSDDSDLYSASEDSGDLVNDKLHMQQSSDDSEDDDYDPDAPDLDEQVKQESSSSDFTSDSEDFSFVYTDKRSPCNNEPISASPVDTKTCKGFDGENFEVVQNKKQSLNDELLSLVESASSQAESAPVPGKRVVERLDYKKLYDEEYGNDSTDSSDEDWKDAADAPRKRRKNNTEAVGLAASPTSKTPVIEGTKDMKQNQDQSKYTPKRRARKKSVIDGTGNSPLNSHPGPSEKSAYKRLGEAATQGLVRSFKENQYPERATKEDLAKELGLTVHQVSKWFENARWSFRHTSRMDASLVQSSPSKGTPSKTYLLKPGPEMGKEDVACNGVDNVEQNKGNADATMGKSLIGESSRQRSDTSRGRKRRNQSDRQTSDHALSTEETQRPSVRKRGRPRTRKSAA